MPASPAAATDAPRALLVFTSLPDAASAETLASALIGRRLAACVNILDPCTSIYRWQGATETATEVPLLIKTTPAHYAALAPSTRITPWVAPARARLAKASSGSAR